LRPPQTSSIPWLPERLTLPAFSRHDFLIATEPKSANDKKACWPPCYPSQL
jgi:hypothetical protein